MIPRKINERRGKPMFCHAFMLEAGLATRSRKAGDFGQSCSAAEAELSG